MAMPRFSGVSPIEKLFVPTIDDREWVQWGENSDFGDFDVYLGDFASTVGEYGWPTVCIRPTRYTPSTEEKLAASPLKALVVSQRPDSGIRYGIHPDSGWIPAKISVAQEYPEGSSSFGFEMWLDISIWSTYVETGGHTVVFRRNGTGKLDCHVNGEPFAIDVHSLELQDGKIIFGGTEAGSSRESSWTSTPVNSLDAERVLALYSENLRVTPLECRPF